MVASVPPQEFEAAGEGHTSAARADRRVYRTADFDYDLPDDLIALRPARRRDSSRLLAVDRLSGALEDRRFADLGALARPGDALVLNDTRVFPARLTGRKPTGARAEILLLRPRDDSGGAAVWEAIVRPGGKLKPGRRVRIADELDVIVLDSLPGGGRLVRLEGPGDPWALIERHGHVPLPPYIERPDDAEDRERYQTVYARHRGSVAAPTAGLHFTPELLAELEQGGVRVARLTLHVGVGTFRPVAAERPDAHRLPPEAFEIGDDTVALLNDVRASGGRVWAVGTTVCRSLESAVDPEGHFVAHRGETDLFIYPPYRFRGVDCLVTNFHLPRSSLLMLVAAFAGHGLTLHAYRHAIRERYRFYSYGDAMVVV
jgi:S-adenosylmethionine:tRNA ribosyltransferase-isomerase